MNATHKKVCLLGASFGTDNMGVGALTAGAVTAIVSQFPRAEIFLLDYGKNSRLSTYETDTRKVPLQLINMRFSKKLWLRNHILVLLGLALLLKAVPSRRLRKKLIDSNFCLSHIAQADLIASLAGGDSFSDLYGIERLLYVSLPQLLVLLMGKPLCLLPQTLGPYRRALSKLIARYILRRAAVVYSRDWKGLEETKGWLRTNGHSTRLRFCYDVGFVVEPTRPAQLELGPLDGPGAASRLVGLNVSGLLFLARQQQSAMGLKVDYERLVYRIMDSLIANRKARIILIPHVFGPGNDSESDLVACERIYESLKLTYAEELFVVRERHDQNEIKYIIGRCNFFIGSRMHACIAALSQCIPAVAIAYSRKFAGVMGSLGLEELVADARKLDEEDILRVIDGAYERSDSIKERLEREMPEVKKTVLNLFKDIEGLSNIRRERPKAASGKGYAVC